MPLASNPKRCIVATMTGNELRSERERRGMSQTTFAAFLGIYQPQLSDYERAGDEPIPAQYRTVERIRRALETGRKKTNAGGRAKSPGVS